MPEARAIIVNGAPMASPATSVSELAALLDGAPQSLAIERNGEAVVRSDWDTTPVDDGDHFEILKIAAGG